MNDDMYMKQLLALMCLVDWLADDLHYKSRGAEFYEKHLLADRIRELGSEDELKEAYWLGFKTIDPPTGAEIAQTAVAAYNKMQGYQEILIRLKTAFDFVLQTVEQCKLEQNLPAGIHAILDGISQKALTYKFLVQASIG